MLFSISRSSIIFLLFVFIISGGKSKLWGKEGKSEEEINSAYYCAKKDVYRYEHWVDKKLFPALLKVNLMFELFITCLANEKSTT